MTTDQLDSFLWRVAYETLLQAYRDCDHRDQVIAFDAQNYLHSEDAAALREALMGRGASWSPLTVTGRGKKGGRRVLRPRSSWMGQRAQ